MSTLTTNYGLVKPALTDSPPDITVMNPNWDRIDDELKNHSSQLAQKVNKDGSVPMDDLTIGTRAAGTIGTNSFTSGTSNIASGVYSHAEGQNTTAQSPYSHSEGDGSTTKGDASHSEGHLSKAYAHYSHVEGNGSQAGGSATDATIGWCAHAEGEGTLASANYSHAEGQGTIASGNCAHAEGVSTTASGVYSHAEGEGCNAIGSASHAGGWHSITRDTGSYGFASGLSVIAAGVGQAVFGKYNVEDTSSLLIVGMGTSDSDKKNAFAVNPYGDVSVARALYYNPQNVEGTDFNAGWLNATGVYYVAGDRADYVALHMPTTYAGVLEIFQIPASGIIIQRYMGWNDNSLYMRRYYNGSWSAWVAK